VTSADVLADLHETLRDKGIELGFAELKDPVKDKLKRFELFAHLGEQSFFPTIDAAVARYLETHQVDWVDWKDETLT
jgi:MFS superfamily sulfate permease-like transporter